ncbi:MAG: hypothetical protein NC204_04895 [Candidatus Amulumruptor caecigallinarius]|nr:hypothetical protein [Candidatus Amulumruptor caecigallinarius]
MKHFFRICLQTAAFACAVTTVSAQMVVKEFPDTKMQRSAVLKAHPAPTNKSRISMPKIKSSVTAGMAQQSYAGKIAPVALTEKVVSKAATDMPLIYGSCLYSNTWAESNPQTGLYKIPTSEGDESEKLFAGPKAQFGGVCYQGYYYATTKIELYGMFLYNEVTVYDVVTGQQVGEPMQFQNMDVLALGLAVHPWGDVWGITYNKDATGYQISWIEYSPTSVEVTNMGSVDAENVHAFAIDKDGNAYAIISDIELINGVQTISNTRLVKVDLYSGALTEVGPTGVNSVYTTGACIDPKTNRMFWTVCPQDETGNLYEVDLTTGAATKLLQFADDAEYAGIYVAASASNEGTPAECTDVNYLFNEDSLTGSVTLTAPSTLIDNETPGVGALSVKVYANEQPVTTADVEWGKQATIDIDLSSTGAGKYAFYVVPINEAGEGPASKTQSMWVGADTPESTSATLKYANGNMELTWNPVTASVNGGYLNIDNLTYTVKRADGSVAAKGLNVTTFTETTAIPESLAEYYYEVYAVADGITSAPARSNAVWLGSVTPPYEADFSTGLNGWTVLDANNDNSYWKVFEGVLRIIYNPRNTMDDWAFTPAVRVEANKAYKVSFDTYSKGAAYAEKVEVKYGSTCTPEGMTDVLLSPTVVTETEDAPQHIEKILVADESGILHIGIHGISDPFKWYLYVANFKISEALEAVTPGVPTDLTVIPDVSGELKATVSFKSPTVDMTGNPLSSLESVEIVRNGEVVEIFENPLPGESLTFHDTLTKAGPANYTVYANNEFGKGLEADASAYVGFFLPEVTSGVTISRTNVPGQAVISWAPVTTDVNGKRYGEGDVKYNLYSVQGQQRKLIAEDIAATSYSYQAVPSGEQEFIRVAVYAKTSVGEGEGYATLFTPVGTPYAGLHESFRDGKLSYNYLTAGIEGGSWSLMTDNSLNGISAVDSDNGYLAATAEYIDQGSELITGMISLNEITNPGISFYTYNLIGNDGESDGNIIKVSVKDPDSEEWTEILCKSVYELCGANKGWSRVSVSLSDYTNRIIQIKLTAICQTFSYTLFDDINVESLLSHDLRAWEISAPAKAVTGTNYIVDVTVANEGVQPSGDYIVNLYENNVLADAKTSTGLASGEKTSFSFTRTMSAITDEDVILYAEVVYNADQNPENNITGNCVVKPLESTLPTAGNLKASSNSDAVNLTWNAPDLSGTYAEPVTYDFEDGDSFADEYGDFIFVDRDGAAVGGFQNMQIPNITSGETTGSYWVWDQNQIENNTFMAHSGSKYLFALYRADNNKSDEWAITPELAGNAQTISFYAKSYSLQYPERIELYYSNGSTNPDDFIKIDDAGGIVPTDWTLYEINVPLGAKRFAIRSCASGSFMLMIDDVTLTPAFNIKDLEIIGYNVYRNGVRINESPISATEYTDNNVIDGETYLYVVTVVYEDKGESAATNDVTLTFHSSGISNINVEEPTISAANGIIVIENAFGMEINVFTADGVHRFGGVGTGHTEICTGAGVYIVKVGNLVRKVTLS